MLKKIFGTIGARYLIAFLNLLLISINGKVLGVEGMGLVGIIYASANIAMIFSSVLCGNTIVYYMNRYDVRFVIWPAYIWAFIGSAIACVIMYLSGMLPDGFEVVIFGLAVLLTLVIVNSRVLLGEDKIKAFNVIFLIQGGLLFFVLLFIYFILNKRSPEAYVWGVFLTNGIAWLVSLILLKSSLNDRLEKPLPHSKIKLIKEMFIYGLWSSADNLAEGLTTRINYFLLQRLSGYGYVGLLDAGTKISESVWHISRSVTFISYSQTTKTKDPNAQIQMTLRFFKLTYCTLILAMMIILLIPEWVYTDYIFTEEFSGIQNIIRGLSVGIIALGSNSILGHYFIGTGKVKYSTVCSCCGLLGLLVSGYFLIPSYGVLGAAISSSIAFSVMLLFSLIVFIYLTKTPFRDLLPTNDDIKRVVQMFKRKKEQN